MSYQKLNIKNYREYLNELKKNLNITNVDEQEVYEFIEDSYNAIENDQDALHKTFVKLFNHNYYNIEKKMFATMMLLLCHQKTQYTRELTEDKKNSPKFRSITRYEEDEENEEDEEEE